MYRRFLFGLIGVLLGSEVQAYPLHDTAKPSTKPSEDLIWRDSELIFDERGWFVGAGALSSGADWELSYKNGPHGDVIHTQQEKINVTQLNLILGAQMDQAPVRAYLSAALPSTKKFGLADLTPGFHEDFAKGRQSLSGTLGVDFIYSFLRFEAGVGGFFSYNSAQLEEIVPGRADHRVITVATPNLGIAVHFGGVLYYGDAGSLILEAFGRRGFLSNDEEAFFEDAANPANPPVYLQLKAKPQTQFGLSLMYQIDPWQSRPQL